MGVSGQLQAPAALLTRAEGSVPTDALHTWSGRYGEEMSWNWAPVLRSSSP
jgi:hypothetical protein